MVSSVLHFGNLKFKQERTSDQALLPDNTVAQKIAKLMGMSVTDFTKALLKPKIKTGREFTVKSQNKAQVGFVRLSALLAAFLFVPNCSQFLCSLFICLSICVSVMFCL